MENDDPNDSEDGTILGPEELDITEEENVLEIDDGRYVISTDKNNPPEPSASTSTSERVPGSTDGVNTSQLDQEQHRENDPLDISTLDQTEVHRWMDIHFQKSDTRYGFDITGKFDGAVSQHHLFSNNVVTAFENLVLWYAQQVGGDTPVEQVLGILLSEANVRIQFPHEAFLTLLDSHNLDGSDTIDELLRSVQDEDGVVLSFEERE